MNIDFANQNVLVTGGTRGIGNQIANDFANLGAHVLITGTKKPKQKIHQNIQFVSANFLDNTSTENFIKEISEQTFDVCVNNAGINKIDPLCEVKEQDWNDVMKVNLTAPFLIQQAVCKNMLNQSYGKIVNISSIWGTVSIPHRASYSASKFGLRGLTAASAAELAQHNILINTVSPGFTLTDLTKQILGEQGIEDLTKQIPMRRMAEVDEISRVVLFMCSKLNTYISGQNIIVDGGFVNV
jgi:3-oxoacyl-[acyl-carrier protein] reductase